MLSVHKLFELNKAERMAFFVQPKSAAEIYRTGAGRNITKRVQDRYKKNLPVTLPKYKRIYKDRPAILHVQRANNRNAAMGSAEILGR